MENGKGCLAVGLANGIGFGSTEFHVLRPKPGVPASYLFQWTKFEELRRRAVNAMTGSAGQQRVPAEFLRSYSIPDHSVNEQRAIARVLDAADHRIQQLEALLAKSIRVNLGITTELLTRGVDAQGRLRDPAKDGFTSSPIGALPDEWALSTLKLVCQKIGVGIATSCSAYFIDKGVPLIRNQNITKDGVSDHDLIHITAVRLSDKVLAASNSCATS